MDLSFVDRNGSPEDTGLGEWGVGGAGSGWGEGGGVIIKITANTVYFYRLNAFRTGQNKRV